MLDPTKTAALISSKLDPDIDEEQLILGTKIDKDYYKRSASYALSRQITTSSDQTRRDTKNSKTTNSTSIKRLNNRATRYNSKITSTGLTD